MPAPPSRRATGRKPSPSSGRSPNDAPESNLSMNFHSNLNAPKNWHGPFSALDRQRLGGFLKQIVMPRAQGSAWDENGRMARVGMGHRRGRADGKGERGPRMAKARSGRHLAGRPESRDKDPSPRHPPGRRRLAGRMPARTGRMPALPGNATLQSLPQFSIQRRKGAKPPRRLPSSPSCKSCSSCQKFPFGAGLAE
jgi:hypothetical protein